MPKFKQLSVSVVTENGNLPSLGIEANLESTCCESYISSSQANKEFWITIKPDENFLLPGPFPPTTDSIKPNFVGVTKDGGGTLGDYLDYDGKRIWEWHLLVKVFLDNLKDAEACSIVYLPWDGRVKDRVIRGRLAYTSDGRNIEKPWYFEEIGLESSVKHLSVADIDASGDYTITGTKATHKNVEEELLGKMQDLRTGMKVSNEPKTGEFGQIRVMFQRIVITGSSKERHYRPELADSDGQRESSDARKFSHLVQVGEPTEVRFSETRKIYREVERMPYAIFIFKYRSDKQLQKMGLLNAPRSARRKLDNVLPYLTPLTLDSSHKKEKPLVEPEVPFSRPSLDLTPDDQGSGWAVSSLSKTSGASNSKELVVRAQSFTDNVGSDSENMGSDDYKSILHPNKSLNVTGAEQQKNIAFITSTTNSITLYPQEKSRASSLCVSPDLDTDCKSDSKVSLHKPLAIMDSEGKRITQPADSEIDGFAEELDQRLQITKRGYPSEDEGTSLASGEFDREEERQPKRIKNYKNDCNEITLEGEAL